jgi:phosphoglycerate dehydrogenase-like enzyme
MNILITDSLFIFPEHEARLREAGYTITRLDKPAASEEELCEAVKGKVGYIFGGIERVTEKVIDAADQLKAIAFTGIGYKTFIPAWEYATQKGIAISNTPSGPTQEVSEWAITACLMMNRNFLELGRAGKKQFEVTRGIEGQKVGIIGFGHTGQRIAEMLKVFRPASVSYYNRHRDEQKETELGVAYLPLNDLLAQSDIVFLCVAGDAKGFMGDKEFQAMKQDALFVSFMHPGVVDEYALLHALQQGRIRAISDYPMKETGFDELPLERWYCMNGTNTITHAGAKLMSDMATQSLLNLLNTGDDQYRVN